MKTLSFLRLSFVCTLFLMACKKDDDEVVFTVPEVRTDAVTLLPNQTVKAQATVLNLGGAEVTDRGFCWGVLPNPVIETAASKSEGVGEGAFELIIDNLASGTHYYIRSYAQNAAGVGYGDQFEVTMAELKSINYFGATIYVYPQDIQPYFVWGPSNLLLDANHNGFGSGNTQTINWHSMQNNITSAASKCSELEYFGHSDWYLPARDELLALYDAREYLGNFAADGDLAKYWSSTEIDSAKAYAVDFTNGEYMAQSKNLQWRCRCIRKP